MKKIYSILVVEDEPDILSMLEEVISIWGYRVIAVSSLQSGLEKLNNQRFDSILLDIGLDQKSGLRALDIIRESKESLNQDTPVLLYSGHINIDTIGGYLRDFDDALTKPVDNDLLKEKLTYWCGRRHKLRKKT